MSAAAKPFPGASQRIFLGPSGWHYRHWVGPFYPLSTRKEGFLAYYASRLRSVEINHSFYRLPEKDTLEAWRETVPCGFTFSVKASRYITHMKKLRETGESLSLFLRRVDVLREKLGPILFQVPDHWHYNRKRFLEFLEWLPAGYRFAFEFRDRSWHNPETYAALRMSGASLCIYEIAGYLSPRETPGAFVYVRLHGPAGAYRGRYDRQTLLGWAADFSRWTRDGLDVYCYFDNDEAGYAALNALMLQEIQRSFRRG